MNDRWYDLNNRSSDKGIKLRQATQQQMLNRALEDAASCINEMEMALSSQDVGQDLRSVKGLNKKQQVTRLIQVIGTPEIRINII